LRKTQTTLYNSSVINHYIKVAIIRDTGVVKIIQSKLDFPYRQGEVSAIDLDGKVIWTKNLED
jgi:hypothetical protein